MAKKLNNSGNYILEKFDSGMHFIMLEESSVKDLTKNKNKRVICTINNILEFHCAIMPKKEGGHFINIGLQICKKLKIQKGSKIMASFVVDETEQQFEMPEELQEVLNTDITANKIFQSLTLGNQRGLMYLVLKLKSIDKRIELSLKIAEKIKNGITSPRLILKKN